MPKTTQKEFRSSRGDGFSNAVLRHFGDPDSCFAMALVVNALWCVQSAIAGETGLVGLSLVLTLITSGLRTFVAESRSR